MIYKLMLAFAVVLGLVTAGNSYYNRTHAAVISQSVAETQALVIAAARVLAQQTGDIDRDGYPEPPLMPQPGVLPANAGTARVDFWGQQLIYCAYDVAAGVATGLSRGDDGDGLSEQSVLIAVGSGGPDRVLQTTCEDIIAGRAVGDDIVGIATVADGRAPALCPAGTAMMPVDTSELPSETPSWGLSSARLDSGYGSIQPVIDAYDRYSVATDGVAWNATSGLGAHLWPGLTPVITKSVTRDPATQMTGDGTAKVEIKSKMEFIGRIKNAAGNTVEHAYSQTWWMIRLVTLTSGSSQYAATTVNAFKCKPAVWTPATIADKPGQITSVRGERVAAIWNGIMQVHVAGTEWAPMVAAHNRGDVRVVGEGAAATWTPGINTAAVYATPDGWKAPDGTRYIYHDSEVITAPAGAPWNTFTVYIVSRIDANTPAPSITIPDVDNPFLGTPLNPPPLIIKNIGELAIGGTEFIAMADTVLPLQLVDTTAVGNGVFDAKVQFRPGMYTCSATFGHSYIGPSSFSETRQGITEDGQPHEITVTWSGPPPARQAPDLGEPDPRMRIPAYWANTVSGTDVMFGNSSLSYEYDVTYDPLAGATLAMALLVGAPVQTDNCVIWGWNPALNMELLYKYASQWYAKSLFGTSVLYKLGMDLNNLLAYTNGKTIRLYSAGVGLPFLSTGDGQYAMHTYIADRATGSGSRFPISGRVYYLREPTSKLASLDAALLSLTPFSFTSSRTLLGAGLGLTYPAAGLEDASLPRPYYATGLLSSLYGVSATGDIVPYDLPNNTTVQKRVLQSAFIEYGARTTVRKWGWSSPRLYADFIWYISPDNVLIVEYDDDNQNPERGGVVGVDILRAAITTPELGNAWPVQLTVLTEEGRVLRITFAQNYVPIWDYPARRWNSSVLMQSVEDITPA